MKRRPKDDYAAALDGLLSELFTDALDVKGWSWAELARQARVSYATVNRLGNRGTRFPLFRTVYRLAVALGYEVRLLAVAAKKGRRVA